MTARRSIIPIFIPHLGCPHDCVFCNQKRISGSLLPARPEDVTHAISSALPRCGRGAELAFYGGSFTAIPFPEQEALLSAAAPFLASGQIGAIRVSTRPDAIDGETLALLRRYGVETVELGAQSMDDAVLAASGRGHTATDTVRAAERIKQEGFTLILQLMTGLPGSDRETDVESARRILALHPDGVRLYPTVVLRDTALYERWKSGAYREQTVEDAVAVCAEILPLLEEAGIPVIRLGLNPTEELSGGGAVAGAYHPALGELVRSRVMLNRVRSMLAGTAPGEELVLAVSPRSRSQLVGQHRSNLEVLRREFGFSAVRIVEKDLKPGEIRRIIVAK